MAQSGSSMSSLWIFLVTTLAACSCYHIHQVPGYIHPKDYKLRIYIDDDGSFNGVVTIKFHTGKDTPKDVRTIVLNSETLKVNSAFLEKENGVEEVLSNFSVNNTLRTVRFNLNSPLEKGFTNVLKISFSGNSSKDGRGLHSLSHLHGFYVTNLRPIYARRLFPCFDQPDKKASFKLTVDTKNTYIISNTPLLNKTKLNDRFSYTFQTTPKIPVHSLFFLTGPTEFSTLDHFHWGNVLLHVYPKFPKDMFFNTLLKICDSPVFSDLWNYSAMDKLDVFVVPDWVEPFYAGYGVLVLRDDIVMFNTNDVTTQLKLNSAYKVLEGLLHVFYGSVVSPSHWEKNWLTSSIAHYLKFRAFNKSENWGDQESFRLLDVHFKTLSTSWRLSSDPVQPTTLFNDTNELQMFIAGSSQMKGASVLTMLETLVPSDKLEKALVQFLAENKYKDGVNETTLFVLLSKLMDNLPVKADDFLNTWITQSGLPLIDLSRVADNVVLNESVYSREEEKETRTVLWSMPVTYAIKSNPKKDPIWFLNEQTTIQLKESVASNEWVVLAVDGKLPMASNYDESSWFLNGEALQENMNSFSPSTRAKLISDAFTMAKDGKNNYILALNLLRYLDSETSLVPWLKAIEVFKEMYTWIFYTNKNSTLNLKKDFQLFVFNRMTPIYEKLDFELNEAADHEKDMLRKEVVGALCYFGYKPCRTKTMELYLKMKTNQYKPPNDMRANLICAGMRNVQNVNEYMEMFYELMNRTHTDPILDIYLDVLACPNGVNSEAIKRYLRMIFLEKDKIPVSKIPVAYKALYTKAEHINQALYFLLHHSNEIKRISSHELGELLNEITEHISTSYHDNMLKSFLESHKKAPRPLLKAAMLGRDKYQRKRNFILKNMADIDVGLNSSPSPPTASPPSPPTGSPTSAPTGSPTTSAPTGSPTITSTTAKTPSTHTTQKSTTPLTTTSPVTTTEAPAANGLSVGSISLITVGVIIAAAIIGLILYYSCRRGGCCA